MSFNLNLNMKYKIVADYPNAGSYVEGLKVLPEIPNKSSIDSSLSDYEILEGVRVVQMSDLTCSPPYSKTEQDRVKNLALEIESNKFIKPLIVVEDKEGLYILEGGHRFDALCLLKKKSFPALVVRDLNAN